MFTIADHIEIIDEPPKTMSDFLRITNRRPSDEYGRLVQFLSIQQKKAEKPFEKAMYEGVMHDVLLLFTEIYGESDSKKWEEVPK